MKRIFILCATCVALTSNAQIFHSITIQPGTQEGMDALIEQQRPTLSDDNEDIAAIAWTAGGAPSTHRSLFQFNLPTLPSNATYVSATLTLYGNPTSRFHQLHSSYPGAPYGTTNECWLQRITSTWSEPTVTWNNQPTVTTTHQIALPASTSQTQDYIINATQIVKDMLDTPSASFGFMLSLQNETIYRSLIFASSDHPDTTKHPKLVITYTTPTPPATAIASISGSDEGVNVYPNPVLHTLHVDFANTTAAIADVQLTDISGRTLLRKGGQIAANEHVSVDVRSLPRGSYFLKVTQDNKVKYNHTITLQ